MLVWHAVKEMAAVKRLWQCTVLGGPSSGYLGRMVEGAENSGSRLARIGIQDGKT